MMMPTIGEYTGLADLVFEDGRFRKRLHWHDDKERYASMAEAGFALYSLKTKKREKGAAVDLDSLNVYACDVGGVRHFHIGHWRDDRVSPIARINRGKAKNEKREARSQAVARGREEEDSSEGEAALA